MAGRIALLPAQADALLEARPDAAVLQEVTAGSLRGWRAALEALHDALARPAARPRVLCGDLNTPRTETVDGRIATFAQRRVGARPIPERGERWDLAERWILTALEEWGMVDVFRHLNGYGARDMSWTWPGHRGGYRLDHVLASPELDPQSCRYRHDWREAGLSDHSAIEVAFGGPGRPPG